MDCLHCTTIVDLDHAFMLTEYRRRVPAAGRAGGPSLRVGQHLGGWSEEGLGDKAKRLWGEVDTRTRGQEGLDDTVARPPEPSGPPPPDVPDVFGADAVGSAFADVEGGGTAAAAVAKMSTKRQRTGSMDSMAASQGYLEDIERAAGPSTGTHRLLTPAAGCHGETAMPFPRQSCVCC